jgi:hypothetical protein
MNITPSSKSNPCQVCGDVFGDCLQGQNQHFWECSTFFSLEEEEGNIDTFQEGEDINGFTFLGNIEDKFSFLSSAENSVRGRFCLDEVEEDKLINRFSSLDNTKDGLQNEATVRIDLYHHTEANPCPICSSKGKNYRPSQVNIPTIVVTLHFDPSSRWLRPPEGINRQQDTKGHHQTGGAS